MGYGQIETPRIIGGFLDIGVANNPQPIANSLLSNQIPQPLAGLAFAQAEEGAVPQLTDPLASNPHHAADLLERTAVTVVQPKVEPKHLGVPRRERGEGRPDIPRLAVGHGRHVGAFLLAAGEAFDPFVAFTVPGGMVEPNRL